MVAQLASRRFDLSVRLYLPVPLRSYPMPFPRLPRITSRALVLALAVVCTSHASAAPLSSIAGDRVVANSAIVASEIEGAIADGETDAAAELRHVIDMNDSFRIYHRDRQILVAMNTRRNLVVGDKLAFERQAAEIARGVLQERFTHLLEGHDGFQGLDPSGVRVVFIEPDAYDGCPGRRSAGGPAGVSAAPVGFATGGLWSSGWATPAPCTNCR